jgi:hypothetical protein
LPRSISEIQFCVTPSARASLVCVKPRCRRAVATILPISAADCAHTPSHLWSIGGNAGYSRSEIIAITADRLHSLQPPELLRQIDAVRHELDEPDLTMNRRTAVGL